MIRKGLSFSNSPGIGYEYSNTGFAILAYILEKVTGETYEHYVTSHILKPLGMEHTYFEYADVPPAALAHGYRLTGGEWVEQPMLHTGIYGAMGGMITTMEDFARYEAFQLAAWPSRSGKEEGPLKRSSCRRCSSPGCLTISMLGSAIPVAVRLVRWFLLMDTVSGGRGIVKARPWWGIPAGCRVSAATG